MLLNFWKPDMATKSRVVIFALVKNNKILVEKRPVEGFVDHQYLIPGGAINTSEDLEQALKREAMEELGVIPIEYELLTQRNISGLHDNILKPFIVSQWTGRIPEFILDKSDPHPLEWMEIEKALKISIKPTRKIFELLKIYLKI